MNSETFNEIYFLGEPSNKKINKQVSFFFHQKETKKGNHRDFKAD